MALRIIVAAALLVLVTPIAAQSSSVVDGSGAAFESTTIEEMITVVTHDFFDPTSAMFRELVASDSGRQICGYVNGKNRFGGYVGYRPFLYNLDDQSGVIYDPSIGALSFLPFEFTGCAERLGIEALD